MRKPLQILLFLHPLPFISSFQYHFEEATNYTPLWRGMNRKGLANVGPDPRQMNDSRHASHTEFEKFLLTAVDDGYHAVRNQTSLPLHL